VTVDKSEKFTWLVRLGFAARGMVYVLLGYLALRTSGAAKEGASSVFDYLQEVPFGTAILWLAAIGLLAYAAFRLLSAFADIQNKGDSQKGLLSRFADFISGATHVFLSYAAYQFATGSKQSAGGSQTQEMVGGVLSWDVGPIVIGLVGVGFLVGAFMQGKQAVTARFMERISPSAPHWTETVGRAGHGARAVVFAVIGFSMIEGAWLASENRVKGLGEAILSLRDTGFVFTFVAIGLALYGIFSLLTARYRIIPDVQKGDIKPHLGRHA